MVLLLLKLVFEEIESRQNRQFGGGVAQNNLFQAKSTGFPRAGRVRIPPSAPLPQPTASPARFLPLPLQRAPIRLQSAAADALPHTALGRRGPPESAPRFSLRGTPTPPLTHTHSQRVAEPPAQTQLCVLPCHPPRHSPSHVRSRSLAVWGVDRSTCPSACSHRLCQAAADDPAAICLPSLHSVICTMVTNIQGSCGVEMRPTCVALGSRACEPLP